MGFQHFIITNFNCYLYENKDINDYDQWMDWRICVFQRFTVPSVLAQTCQQFTWLVQLSPQTPQHYQQKIQSIIHEVNGRIVGQYHDVCGIPKDIPNADKYIYSILESDDAIPKQYIQQIQDVVDIYPVPFLIDMTTMFRVSYDLLHYQVVYQFLRLLLNPIFSCEIFSVVTNQRKIPPIEHQATYNIYPQHYTLQNAGVQITHKANQSTGFHDTDYHSPIIHRFPNFLMSQYGWDLGTMRNLIND